MVNIKLILEYDGSAFHGWQKQPGMRTIQSELHRVLEQVLREEIRAVHASGRTDAGVHAKGQVVNFKVTEAPDLDRLKHSVSSLLKGEVAVVAAEIVPNEFHACHSACSKQYTYTILNRSAPSVLKKQVWHVGAALDYEVLRREAEVLAGTHDFKSFQCAGCAAGSTVREIFTSEVIIEEPYIYYRVIGSGFLKQMVRSIVGTLVAQAKGDQKLGSMEEMLAARDRRAAGPTAPARGLCLDQVFYQ